MAGKPVVFGPHMENFATLAKALVLKKGAIQVRDADSLEMTIAGLLRNSDARERLLENARDVLSKHRGATARAAELIHQFQLSLWRWRYAPVKIGRASCRERVEMSVLRG